MMNKGVIEVKQENGISVTIKYNNDDSAIILIPPRDKVVSIRIPAEAVARVMLSIEEIDE